MATPDQPLQYKTVALRVSIHCEGCKKKVKKVLQKLDKVYTCEIDAAQHKVVVTGDVDAEMLIRRLHRYGKLASEWPEQAKKPTEAPSSSAAAVDGKAEKEAYKGAVEKAKNAGKPAEDGNTGKIEQAAGGGEKKPEKDAKPDSASGEAKEEKSAAKVDDSGEVPPAASEEQPNVDGVGKKKNKKNKKKSTDNEDGETNRSAAPVANPTPIAEKKTLAPPPASPAPEYVYPYAGMYAPPPYVMSYSVAQPSASVSYRAPAAPPPPTFPVGYMYGSYAPRAPPPEYCYGPRGSAVSPGREEYGLFNDENANGCAAM